MTEKNLDAAYADDESKQTPKPKAEKKKAQKVKVREVTHPSNEEKWVVVDEEGNGYCVPKDRCKGNYNVHFEIEIDSEVERLYNWDTEILSILPDYETIKANILYSFWRAGALQEGDLGNPSVAAKVLKTAFPYKL